MTGQDELLGVARVLVADAQALTAEVAEDRTERRSFEALVRKAIKVGAALIVLVLIAIVGNSVSNWQQSRAADELKRQAAAQEAARESSREILRTLLAYADPESDVSKQGQARQATVIAGLLSGIEAAVRRGSMDTLEIRRCANTPETFETCVAEKLPHLVATPAP